MLSEYIYCFGVLRDDPVTDIMRRGFYKNLCDDILEGYTAVRGEYDTAQGPGKQSCSIRS